MCDCGFVYSESELRQLFHAAEVIQSAFRKYKVLSYTKHTAN